MARLIIFIVSSIAVAYVSRHGILRPRSHGFYRFFAWECIIALILLNIPCWFRDPLSLQQVASWLLLCASLVALILGVRQLTTKGRPDPSRRDEARLLGIEKTTELVTSGVFRYVRHPMYSSLLLLAWGAFFKSVSWVGGGLAAAATGFLVVTAKVEEGENVRYFGDAYKAYMRDTKMFIPFLF